MRGQSPALCCVCGGRRENTRVDEARIRWITKVLADQARKYVISECGVNLDGDSMIALQ